MAFSLSNCATAYDAYGRPYQVVTPGGAVLGAAAVGAVAYGLGRSDGRRHHHRHYHRGYPRYHRGYY